MTASANKLTFTKEEIDNLLGIQALNLGLKTVIDSINALKLAVELNSNSAEREFRDILEELRKEEVARVKVKNEIREEMFEKFIQKKELKVYLAIIAIVVSIATGVVQWVVADGVAKDVQIQTAKSNQIMMKELIEVVKDRP